MTINPYDSPVRLASAPAPQVHLTPPVNNLYQTPPHGGNLAINNQAQQQQTPEDFGTPRGVDRLILNLDRELDAHRPPLTNPITGEIYESLFNPDETDSEEERLAIDSLDLPPVPVVNILRRFERNTEYNSDTTSESEYSEEESKEDFEPPVQRVNQELEPPIGLTWQDVSDIADFATTLGITDDMDLSGKNTEHNSEDV